MKKIYIPTKIDRFLMLDMAINECTSEEFNQKYPNWCESENNGYYCLPDELFLIHSEGKFVGIDNTSRDCVVEEFDSRQECINWLVGDPE